MHLLVPRKVMERSMAGGAAAESEGTAAGADRVEDCDEWLLYARVFDWIKSAGGRRRWRWHVQGRGMGGA